MKVLKNNPGEAEVIKIDVSDLQQLTIACDNKVVAHMYLPEYKITDDVEQKAKTMADSITTYNKCGKLPSELMEENRELVEALKSTLEQFKRGDRLYSSDKRVIANSEAILTKIENKE